MKRYLFGVVAMAGVIILCAGFYFLGDKQAVQAMTITRITPDQATSAMQADHFYSDYRRSTLLISGKVSSVMHNRDLTEITLVTTKNPNYLAYCDMASGSGVPKVGDNITLLSEGGSAVRRSTGVLLTECTTF